MGRLREERGWTKAELAKRAGVAAATITHIESGRTKHPDRAILRRVATALEIPPQRLEVLAEGPIEIVPVAEEPTIQELLDHIVQDVERIRTRVNGLLAKRQRRQK